MSREIETFLAIIEQEVRGYQVPVVDLIAVQSRDPYKVLVATILSARTKDEVTAKAAARLFAKAPTLQALAGLGEEELARLIFPVGFYKNKAKYLQALPQVLAERFASQIPADLDRLLELPGVGRKTANLVLAQAFAIPAICVDTHVHRIMNIWGYVQTKTPLETEMALREKLPVQYWIPVNSLLVAFGQGTCRPLAPACDRCVLAERCPRIGVTPRKGREAARPGSGRLRMLSWNVNGLRAVAKNGFLELVARIAPDLLALQEIKAQEEQLPLALREIEGYRAFFYPAERKGYSGVAVYTRLAPEQVILGIGDERFDREGRVLTLEFADFFLVNGYFPNSRGDLSRLPLKEAFNLRLQEFVLALAAKKSVVLCGDLNVAHREIDLANPKENERSAGFTREERAWMDGFVALGWVDSFRHIHGEQANRYSWWSYRSRARERNIGWRIDYFMVDPASRQRIKGAEILQEILGSDHCPVLLDFQ